MPQLELDKSSVRIVTGSPRYCDEKAEELHALIRASVKSIFYRPSPIPVFARPPENGKSITEITLNALIRAASAPDDSSTLASFL